MKLHTKLILWIISSIVVVVSAAQAWQYYSSLRQTKSLSEAHIALLNERAMEHANDVRSAVSSAVADSLERGEMEKFSRILVEQSEIKGLLEYSLFDRDGVVKYSSKPEFLGRQIDRGEQEQALKNDAPITVLSEKGIEIFQQERVKAECTRCHQSWKEHDTCGISYFRFSAEAIQKASQDAENTIKTLQRSAFFQAGGSLAVIVIILVISVYLLLRKLVGGPLEQFSAFLEQFEKDEGDLTRRISIETRDEIGNMARLFNAFISGLNNVMIRVQGAAFDLGDKAQEQSANVEKASSAIQAIATDTTNNASSATEAHGLMEQVGAGMEKANQAVVSLTETMKALNETSLRTMQIVKSIDEIAFQTNLLALNAAVEAARAGEAGRGFSVVAEEVRNLAQRAASASQTTSALIEETVGGIQKSVTLVENTRTNFAQVSSDSTSAARMVANIADASKRQEDSIEQVGKLLEEMNAGAGHNAEMAEQLRGTVEVFKTEEEEGQEE